MAALTICKPLLVVLRGKAILSASEFQEILEDAAAAHGETTSTTDHPDKHNAIAALIEVINSAN